MRAVYFNDEPTIPGCANYARTQKPKPSLEITARKSAPPATYDEKVASLAEKTALVINGVVGNQSDRVCVHTMTTERLLTLRWPA
jgi:hypothetical protein